MNHKYFFITNYDDISSSLIAFLLNSHPDIECSIRKSNILLESCHDDTTHVDDWIEMHSNANKLYNGNINQFTAYELQNRILLEKTRHPLRMINLVASPYLRIKLLMQSWLGVCKTPEMTLDRVEKQFEFLRSHNHELITRYQFNNVFWHVHASAVSQGIDLTIPKNRIFISALTKMIIQDSADLPTSGKKFLLENLVTDETHLIELIQTINPEVNLSSLFRINLKQHLKECRDYINNINAEIWEPWMSELVAKYISLRLQTIYYPHVDKPLIPFYRELGYTFPEDNAVPYSKLISIQLNSNRPAQLSIYFDNIEETADCPEQIEVLVNIDDDDLAMREMLEREIPLRKFTIKYVTTEKPKSFCDLWKPINKLLTVTDPDAYFLLNISDEMLFATQGWDSVLKKYAGFFPDHLFRLRASRNKIRNYFDRWECSFGQDAIPITTKKWVDIGGDWNPCFGPDSFQQLISYYLAREGQFSNAHYLRDLPIIDIRFHGDIPALGIHPLKAWKHNRDHIFAMQICQSWEMQLEAKRRAILIKAHIIVERNQLSNVEIVDNKHAKEIHIVDAGSGKILEACSYNVNWFTINFTNQIRKFQFYAYFGAGKDYPHGYITGFAAYLKSKYLFFLKLHDFIRKVRFLLLYFPRKFINLFHKGLTKGFNLSRGVIRRAIRALKMAAT